MQYAYSRNNHLEPYFTFGKCKELLPRLLEVDCDCAIRTAEQLCDECISYNLDWNFSDGIDDEHNNRERSIEFTNWLLNWIHDNGDEIYCPFNYDRFIKNVAIDDKPLYLVSELYGFNADDNTWFQKVILNNCDLLSKNNYLDYIFKKECGLDKAGETVTYNQINIFDGAFNRKPTKYVYIVNLKTPRTFLVERIKPTGGE